VNDASVDLLVESLLDSSLAEDDKQRLADAMADADLRKRVLAHVRLHGLLAAEALERRDGAEFATGVAEVLGRRQRAFVTRIAQETKLDLDRPSPISTRVRQKARPHRTTRVGPPRRRSRAPLVALLAVLGVLGLLVWRYASPPTDNRLTVIAGTITLDGRERGPGRYHIAGSATIATDKEASLRLAEGLAAELGADTRLEWRRSDAHIELDDGTVTVDIDRPQPADLLVATRDATVVTLGTRFRVALVAGGTDVVVTRGRVRVDHGGERTILGADQRLLVPHGVAPPPWLRQDRPDVFALNDHLANTAVDEVLLAAHAREDIALHGLATTRDEFDGLDELHPQREALVAQARAWGWPVPPLYRGTDAALDDDATDIPVADALIAAARPATPDEPLFVVSGGALTDLALALRRAPAIAERVVVTAIGDAREPLAEQRFTALDPGAARLVLERVATILVPQPQAMTWTARIGPELPPANGPLAETLAGKNSDVLRQRDHRCYDLPALLPVLDPAWAQGWQRYRLTADGSLRADPTGSIWVVTAGDAQRAQAVVQRAAETR